MLRPAAMREPAHQGGVAAGHLHPVDAEVEAILAALARPLGYDQWPGDERRRLARPAGLHRQGAKVDLGAAQHDLLAGCGRHRARPHRHHRAQERQQLERLAPAARRLGLFQKGEGAADLAQIRGLAVHAPGDPLDRAEEIDQDRHRIEAAGIGDRLEQHRGPPFGQQPRLDLGHFEDRRDRGFDPRQPPAPFEAVDEVAQARIRHGRYMGSARRRRERGAAQS